MVPERRTSLKQGPWRVKDQPLKTQTEPQNHKSNSCQIRSSGKKKILWISTAHAIVSKYCLDSCFAK